jgi:hypothetical protein
MRRFSLPVGVYCPIKNKFYKNTKGVFSQGFRQAKMWVRAGLGIAFFILVFPCPNP